MARTLLPVWNIYKQSLELQPEPEDTFDWVPNTIDRNDLTNARDTVNSIPGARQWLSMYNVGDEDPYMNKMAVDIASSLGKWHSGASSFHILFWYKKSVNNWNKFVKDYKEIVAKKKYHNNQLEKKEVYEYYYSTKPYSNINPNDIIAGICLRSGLTRDKAHLMMLELKAEYDADYEAARVKAEKERYDESIKLLEHHYKHPQRWSDSERGSSLFGSPRSITNEMMILMESRHPGYKKHIADMIALGNF